MTRTHWAPGDKRRWLPNRRRYEWRTICGRWLPLSSHATPNRVTCKQCRRYLEGLTVDGERLRR